MGLDRGFCGHGDGFIFTLDADARKTLDLSSLANAILFSPQLADKLAAAEACASAMDHARDFLKVPPQFPTREAYLDFVRERPSKSSFPSKASFDHDRARGLVLHHFANHELLAMELMALALLRFPAAEVDFRRGLARTIAEEASHMRLYIARMKDLGVDFGEAPLSAFFWTCMREMSSPLAYVTQMSMTFEQANLDYALHYAGIFAQLGDKKTVDILERVYREEIGHVKHGVCWFQRWKEPQQSDWDAYAAQLNFPLSPSRAKGIGFDMDGRRKAGLTEEFIHRLATYSQSKGRHGFLRYFNPWCESALGHPGAPYVPSCIECTIQSDLECLMIFLASSDDVLLLSRMPSDAFLLKLRSLSVMLPHFSLLSPEEYLSQKGRIADVKPWGQVDPSAAGGKQFAAECAVSFGDTQPVALSRIVIKSNLGTSGRGHFFLSASVDTPQDAKALTRIAGRLQRGENRFVIEPWVERVDDLSVQAEVDRSGVVSVLGVTRFITRENGAYRGHIVGRWRKDWAGSRAYQEAWQARLHDAARHVGAKLFARGYSGPFGVDAFTYRDGDRISLRPIVEVNPRYTMGRIALALSQRVLSGRVGLWLHVSEADLKRAGVKDFPALHEKCEALLPWQIKRIGDASFIASGVWFTSEASHAKKLVTILFVGESLAAITAKVQWLVPNLDPTSSPRESVAP